MICVFVQHGVRVQLLIGVHALMSMSTPLPSAMSAVGTPACNPSPQLEADFEVRRGIAAIRVEVD